ncbi:CU044_5270 family protein [Actinomadura violacea]|uniref:CU044_5270 family protein n=1 Tax=Actinomadura violacea TaxID=2819934 RepID=A0ABS3RR99_9ACTN|nr:CU044_5270 family protein [Actinomadura violacea]MBO2459156.1 CU044_5270 family protein [Actinomadura violacea]
MDEMAMLRAAGPDVAPPTDAALQAGRDRLTAAARPARRRRPRLPKPAAMGLLAGAAAVAGAAAITIAQVVAPDGHGSATAAAAEVLRDAAATARSAPPVRTGAYSYTRELVVGTGTGPDTRQCAETWFRRDGSLAAGEGYPERAGGRCDPKDHPKGPPLPADGADDHRPHADVRTLPVDPAALRGRLYSDAAHDRGQNPGDGGSRDERVFDRIGRLLRMTLPPELRAALFETLATIPGVDVARGEKDALGRTGIALARPFGDARFPGRVEIILAPGTYRYLGAKAVQDMGDGSETDLSALLVTAVVPRPLQRP